MQTQISELEKIAKKYAILQKQCTFLKAENAFLRKFIIKSGIDTDIDVSITHQNDEITSSDTSANSQNNNNTSSDTSADSQNNLIYPPRSSEDGINNLNYPPRSSEDGINNLNYPPRSSEDGINNLDYPPRSSEDGINNLNYPPRSSEDGINNLNYLPRSSEDGINNISLESSTTNKGIIIIRETASINKILAAIKHKLPIKMTHTSLRNVAYEIIYVNNNPNCTATEIRKATTLSESGFGKNILMMRRLGLLKNTDTRKFGLTDYTQGIVQKLFGVASTSQ